MEYIWQFNAERTACKKVFEHGSFIRTRRAWPTSNLLLVTVDKMVDKKLSCANQSCSGPGLPA